MTMISKPRDIVRNRGTLRKIASLSALVVTMAVAPQLAQADTPFSVSEFDVTFTKADGSPATQAGSHPYQMTTTFALGASGLPNLDFNELKDAYVEQIVGLVGDSTAVPRCSAADFNSAPNAFDNTLTNCPDETAVGTAGVVLSRAGNPYNTISLFNLDPGPGEPARLGFNILGNRVVISVNVKNDGQYNIVAAVRNAPQALKAVGSQLTVWGVPSDPSHDALRGSCLEPGTGASLGLCPTSAPAKPFLTLPRACAGPLTSTITADGWGTPGVFDIVTSVTHGDETPANPLGMTGCSRLGFDPSASAVPTTSVAGGPSGLDYGLNVDDEGLVSPDGLAQADIHKTVVTLPQGMTANPALADGLAACSPADLQRETVSSAPGAGCPSASKVGTAEVQSPLLSETIPGSLYVATQNQNPFNSLLAFYLVLKSPSLGILVKQPAKVDLDPVTGQLTTTVDDIPQLPFSRLGLHVKGGDRGALVAPPGCGPASTETLLTPSSLGPPAQRRVTATFDQACDRAGRFEPTLDAGLSAPAAGGSSDFSLSVVRPDGQQALKGLDVTLPPGLVGKIASVPLCAEAQAAAGSCPAASRVGQVKAAVGAGANPLTVPQAGKAPTAVYLAGPYKGAPFSLSVVVPAQAGPFDLGTVVVRAGLFVDPIDAHVTVRSDPLPTILQGIPLMVRTLRVSVDRPGFMIAPTSCSPMAVAAGVTSVAGTTAALSSPFQVDGCAALELKPSLALALSGKGQTTDGKHPAVAAQLTQPVGQSNLKKVRVALPLSLALDPDNANGLCEFVDGSKVEPTCPKASIVGTATAVTPILDQPLSGPVYFVKNIRKDPKSGREIRTLPKLVIPLVGQNGLRLTLTGTSNVEDDQLVTTFDNIPDAPVSSFKLNINGGKGGILTVSGADICKSAQVADQQVDGQNGKAADVDIFIQTPNCPLKVLSKKVGKKSVAVKVGGLSAGKVTVSGRGIKKTTKTVAKSTVATITAKRTKGKPGKVTVSFDPAGPAKARKTSK